jgi:hypothetical protein
VPLLLLLEHLDSVLILNGPKLFHFRMQKFLTCLLGQFHNSRVGSGKNWAWVHASIVLHRVELAHVLITESALACLLTRLSFFWFSRNKFSRISVRHVKKDFLVNNIDGFLRMKLLFPPVLVDIILRTLRSPLFFEVLFYLVHVVVHGDLAACIF